MVSLCSPSLLCTRNPPKVSDDAATAPVDNCHRQRKWMNSHLSEKGINWTKQHPPRKGPERWISMVEEMAHRFIHRSFFQDSLKVSCIFLKPLREQIMFRASAASIAPRPPPQRALQ
jgi:hypothetical protein